MILYYTDSKEQYIAEYVSQVVHDDCLSINERIEQNDTSDLFSGNAYVLIIGTHSGAEQSLYENLAKSQFRGSKILYCLFIMTRINNASFKVSEICTQRKGLILFGYDFISPSSEKRDDKLKQTAEFIRDCIPLKNDSLKNLHTI